MPTDRKCGSNADERDARGRFAQGNKGKPRGTRHRATQAVETLLQGEAESLTRAAIDAALGGDVTALRLCLDRIAPARKDPPVQFDLPAIESVDDVAGAGSALLAAVAAGEVSPSEAASIGGLLASHARILELTELEARVAKLEEGLK